MDSQFKIEFPPDMFDKIRASEPKAYIAALEQKIQRLELSLRSLKGHFTKRKKRSTNP